MPIFMTITSSHLPGGSLKVPVLTVAEGMINDGTFGSTGAFTSNSASYPIQVTLAFQTYDPTIWLLGYEGALIPAVQLTFEKPSGTSTETYLVITLSNVVIMKYETSTSSAEPTVTIEMEALKIEKQTFLATGASIEAIVQTNGKFVAWPPPC